MAEFVLQLSAPFLCDICKKLLEDEIGKLSGVEAVEAETRARRATIRFDERLISPEEMAEVARQFGCHTQCWFFKDDKYKQVKFDFYV